jgi:hypothetical protein
LFSALNPPTLRQRLNQMAVIAGDEFFGSTA